MNQKRVLLNFTIQSFFVVFFLLLTTMVFAQHTKGVEVLKATGEVKPLERVTLNCSAQGTLIVYDGKGIEYFRTKALPTLSFIAGGAAGTQRVVITDKNGNINASATFTLDASTALNDGGKYTELFNIAYKGMMGYGRKGYGEIKWRGESYKFYVPWDLDNNNVMNGIQYFSPYGNGLTDLLRKSQRADGLIWSFVRGSEPDMHYFETAYAPTGYFQKDENAWFVRQPVDNHSDYNYVNMFYKHWKASGDNAWMKKTLASAALALDYCYTDSDRWSKRFQLLKRPYCIDSWDFQVEDEYTPDAPVSKAMVIVPGKTKFGVFFGDNTGYFEACNQVAEMYDFVGDKEKAMVYRKRADQIITNLTQLSWNGKFFTHFIDEDPTVKRNLGVDEKSQIAQGNMYSLNRGLPQAMNVAIIKTYLELKDKLPVGSPGEWYAIYPPFQKGFGAHNDIWQYMNGGVAGHAIGELARGAYENGYEAYGSDILSRLTDLGKKYNNKIYFSYTGAFLPPPTDLIYKTVDISAPANMDLWDKGSDKVFKWMNEKKPGNDMRGLPVGNQTFGEVKYKVIDPSNNQRRSAIALSVTDNFPTQAEVVVNDSAKSVYLLHSTSGVGGIAGGLTFFYTDSTFASKYIKTGEDVVGWWFPALKTDRSGVAWAGPNMQSTEVGVCWSAIDNPVPTKKIAKIRFTAPLEGGIYAVLGVTLANHPRYIKPSGESYGGPDNWAAANGMAALIEGLAGVKNTGLAYETVKISPRWTSAGVDSVGVTAQLAASGGYIAYKYENDKMNKEISMNITGSGKEALVHVLLPKNAWIIKSIMLNDRPIEFKLNKVENSQYVDFNLLLGAAQKVVIKYE